MAVWWYVKSHFLPLLYIFNIVLKNKRKNTCTTRNQVCERSLNNTQNGPTVPPVQHFVRADMLPSGYLIRPCEGGGSIIRIVDHMELEVCNKYLILTE